MVASFSSPSTRLTQPSSVRPLGFELLTEIPLPGPLPGERPELDDPQTIRIPVAGATALLGGGRRELVPLWRNRRNLRITRPRQSGSGPSQVMEVGGSPI